MKGVPLRIDLGPLDIQKGKGGRRGMLCHER